MEDEPTAAQKAATPYAQRCKQLGLRKTRAHLDGTDRPTRRGTVKDHIGVQRGIVRYWYNQQFSPFSRARGTIKEPPFSTAAYAYLAAKERLRCFPTWHRN